MSPERAPDDSALQRALEREREMRERAEREAEQRRRYAQAIDRHSAIVLDERPFHEQLDALLALFVEVSGASVGLVTLREKDELVARARIGPEEVVGQRLRWPVTTCLAGMRPMSGDRTGLLGTLPAPAEALFTGSEVGAVTLVRLEQRGQLAGAVILGAPRERPWSPADVELVGVLATRTAAALALSLRIEAYENDVRTRDEVLAVVAHDLQNPLNVISMATNMLLGRAPEQTVRRPVERITRAVQRATRLLRDLLDISAIQAGRFSIERSPLDAAQLLLTALESQQSLAADASVIIASDLSPELPAIDADEERLLEVLENLVGNAVKFTSPGGTITVGAARAGDDVKFWVTDSGAGIPADDLPRIFDRFWQAKRSDRRGSGLGLAICKGIVDAHGGRIWAESKVGVGTTVSFTIPARLAPRSSLSSTNVANILLVDDRPENLLALTAILERPDYRLVTAESGEQALRLALREHFAVALIDIAMPGMNGLEVAVHLKELERSRDIPIIFITAFGDDPEEIHRAYAAGGADYLVKPLDAEIVKKKVAVFVDLSRKRLGGSRQSKDGVTR